MPVSPLGKPVPSTVSGEHYQRETFLAAKVGCDIIAPFCYQGTCNTDLFNLWLEQILVPELKPGQVVILDNASFHQSQKKGLVQSAGCQVLFLPPYSIDLSSIELFWATLKRTIKENLKKLLPYLKRSIIHF
ncbi:transposase [Candidatus Protochlamydia sp. W-9]|uniref:transposase n=1 Tax=Candidatus Protochlamydia sp. W-9 TaxID=1785087 RepID=UPI00096A9CE4|nr:transposase [Candidatus Protochlamydia sp. W-9]